MKAGKRFFSQILVPAIAILSCSTAKMAGRGLEGNHSMDPGIWYAWEKRCWLDKSGNEECLMDGNKACFHLVILNLDSSGIVRITKSPAFINPPDTSYSGSDGGFFEGVGKMTTAGDSAEFEGRYTKVDYSRLKDSSFNMKFLRKGKIWSHAGGGGNFSMISPETADKLLAHWK